MNPKLTNVAKYCFAIFLFNCFFTANAQTNKNSLTKFYLQGAAGASSKSGSFTELSLQGVVRNKWSFTLSYHDLTMQPKNQPSDYQPETGVVFLIPYTNNIKVNMKLFSFTAGKYFSLGRNTWLTTEAGLSIVQGEKASFQKTASQSSDPLLLLFLTSYTTSNYNTSIESANSAGVMMRADFNWAFCAFMGLGAEVFANFNSIQSPVGYQLKLILGVMGRHTKMQKRK